ncbi:hypothetical protein A3A60_04575 [Candidatus Curtissbacteria bacterium RIFCSPLOWO2_01_FULL_42_26]|uniref:Uncharacterized protein n=1 Tax=Candidatus Curtissbacteria bacterium RIFCSPLOWO2_01_FULL_42_26 TaxID=1797729 RepID=A0A1F5HXW8_9BACT|nr:MAG: hypothetical protein A3A60_04575 [Candidatus Curtissbacteria bacterium RIFCSPLOWO2_01_FULL_42_26]
MQKNGFAHIIPLVIIATVVIGGFSALSTLSEQRKREAVGKVLSESSDDEDRSGSSSSSGSSGGKSGETKSSTSNQTSGSSDKFKIESETGTTKTKIEKDKQKSEIKVESEEGKFETKTEEGKQKTKIETGGLRIEIRIVNGQTIVKIKNEHGEEIEASREAENELLEDANEKLEEEDIQIASDSAGLGFIQHGKKVRTNFPLTIDPATGQLFVTTPAGTKVVAILPDVAIQNMLAAGILTHVEQSPSPSPQPSGSTPSASATPSATVEGTAIELTQVQDQPVYIISGIRQQNFLGIVPVDIKLKAVVSIQNGQLVDVQQGILARVLDIFSF